MFNSTTLGNVLYPPFQRSRCIPSAHFYTSHLRYILCLHTSTLSFASGQEFTGFTRDGLLLNASEYLDKQQLLSDLSSRFIKINMMNKSVIQLTTDPWIDIEPLSNVTKSLIDRDLTSNVHINEKLLLEAQKESSRVSSKGSPSESSSPKSSPQTTDWASYYSSRIESDPPKEWKFPHSINPTNDDDDKQQQLIERKHLRFVFLSNCASFILGMGIMYLCLRRYLRLKTPYFYSLN